MTNTLLEPVLHFDQQLADATALAKEAAIAVADFTDQVGEAISFQMIAEFVGSHHFNCNMRGYQGWFWDVTVVRVDGSDQVTVSEVELMPGSSALLAPNWIPWADRLQPGDVSREDVLPFDANDVRLAEGIQLEKEQLKREAAGLLGEGGTELVEVASELLLTRERVPSLQGMQQAAERWLEKFDVDAFGSAKGKEDCTSCGFVIPLQGQLGQLFGVCMNEWSADDGRVVPLNHSCGSHSQTDLPARQSAWQVSAPLIDDQLVETVQETNEKAIETVDSVPETETEADD